MLKNGLNNPRMGKSRNCTIDILRLFFAIMVVAIHTSPLAEYNSLLSYFCSQTISRLAIPFFAGVTGYFFFKKNIEEQYRKYIKRYILLYTFWSVLMLLNDAVHWDGKITLFVLYAMKTFFLTGWRQLWYLLAIIYIILILAFTNRISCRSNEFIYCFSFLLLFCGIATANYGKVFSNIYALNIYGDFFQNSFTNWPMILPFFMIGYRLNKSYPDKYKKRALPLAILCMIGLLLEILFTTLLDLHENVVLCLFTYPAIYFILIWAVNNEYSNLTTAARYCSRMASVIYLGHSLLQFYLVLVNAAPTVSFLVCTLVPALIGWILTRINNPRINMFI